MDTTALVIAFLAGCLLGGLVGLVLSARTAAARSDGVRAAVTAASADALHRTSEQFLALAETRLGTERAHASGELEQRRQAVEHLVEPLLDTLGRVEQRMQALEMSRERSQGALSEQVEAVRLAGAALRDETRALVTALRKPQTRGRWGELQLRRVVELAGMAERCDVTEQLTVGSPGAALRPDLVVHLAGGKTVVVDAKVTLAAYLEAHEAVDDDVRDARLTAHARHLRQHVDRLAAKAYWTQFDAAPEFVVLFVPGESFLAPALDRDPTLLEHALARRVHIATPTTLVSMLRTVAYAWQQQALADNAREVFRLGRELYARLGQLGAHVDDLGRSIARVVGQYNATVGSLESRALVSARRLRDIGLVDDELPGPQPVDEAPPPRWRHRSWSRRPVPGGALGRRPTFDPESVTDPRYGAEPSLSDDSGARAAG